MQKKEISRLLTGRKELLDKYLKDLRRRRDDKRVSKKA
jgi:hypothetical protein